MPFHDVLSLYSSLPPFYNLSVIFGQIRTLCQIGIYNIHILPELICDFLYFCRVKAFCRSHIFQVFTDMVSFIYIVKQRQPKPVK